MKHNPAKSREYQRGYLTALHSRQPTQAEIAAAKAAIAKALERGRAEYAAGYAAGLIEAEGKS